MFLFFNKYLTKLGGLVLILIILLGNLSLVNAQSKTIQGLDSAAGKVEAFADQTGSNFQNNFLQTKTGQIIGLVLSFVGVLFLVLMIYAGLTWMTAGGNQEKVKKAKDLMINAIIGLVVVLGAYAITAFVGEQLTQ